MEQLLEASKSCGSDQVCYLLTYIWAVDMWITYLYPFKDQVNYLYLGKDQVNYFLIDVQWQCKILSTYIWAVKDKILTCTEAVFWWSTYTWGSDHMFDWERICLRFYALTEIIDHTSNKKEVAPNLSLSCFSLLIPMLSTSFDKHFILL